MGGPLRFAPCPEPGCPETVEDCQAHRKVPWAGRNGTTRMRSLGVTDKEWGRIVRGAMKRDGSKCLRCGGEANHVDHLVPVAWHRPPSGYKAHLAQVGCLCEGCHAVKTKAEARLGRMGRPNKALIASHVRWWLGQLPGGVRAN
jgi:5-methylcytosine-specific restriction endonuclease McrA